MIDREAVHRHRRQPSPRGRSQDEGLDGVILAAALALLGEGGYHALTMSEVAARAGVSKATLYRRWTAKPALVSDALATVGFTASPSYPGTSVRDDLIALLAQGGGCSNRPRVLALVMDAARSVPELGSALRERFAAFMRSEIETITSRATEAGNRRLSEIELDHVADTAIALLAYHAGAGGSPLTPERLALLVDNVLLVLVTGRRRSTSETGPDS